jgi:hypothetical protein
MLPAAAAREAARHAGPPGFTVYGLLVLYANERSEAWPSVPRLAEEAGLSVRCTRATLRKLEAAGLVITIPEYRPSSSGEACAWRNSNRYRLPAHALLRAADPRHDMPDPRHHMPDPPARHAGDPGTVCRQTKRLNQTTEQRARAPGKKPEAGKPDPENPYGLCRLSLSPVQIRRTTALMRLLEEEGRNPYTGALS